MVEILSVRLDHETSCRLAFTSHESFADNRDTNLIFDGMHYPLPAFCAFTGKNAYFAELVDMITNSTLSLNIATLTSSGSQ